MKTFVVLAALVAACSACFQHDLLLDSNNNAVLPTATLRPSDLHFKPNMTAFTISFWAYPLNDDPHFFFVFVVDGANFIAWRSNKNNAQLAIGSEIQPIGNATFTPPNKWTLVTVTWENVNGTAKVYIDGELTAATTNFKKGKVFAANGNAAYIAIGLPFTAPGNPTPLPLNSRLTELNVWSRELPPSEVRDIFYCFHTESGDVAMWEDAVWSINKGGTIVETTLDVCSLAVEDYLELILDLLIEIFIALFSEPEVGLDVSDPLLGSVGDTVGSVGDTVGNIGLDLGDLLGGLGKRDILPVVSRLVKRDVLPGIGPHLFKRNALPSVVQRRLKRKSQLPEVIPRVI